MNSNPLAERASKLGNSPRAPSTSSGNSGPSSTLFRAPRGEPSDLRSPGPGHRAIRACSLNPDGGAPSDGRPPRVRAGVCSARQIVEIVHYLHLSARLPVAERPRVGSGDCVLYREDGHRDPAWHDSQVMLARNASTRENTTISGRFVLERWRDLRLNDRPMTGRPGQLGAWRPSRPPGYRMGDLYYRRPVSMAS